MAVDFVDAEDVWLVDDDLLKGFVLPHAVRKSCENGYDAVGVDTGVDAHREGGDGEVAGKVGDGRDLAVGDDVDGAVAVAERGATEGEIFDRTLQAGDFDGVTHVVLVFEEDEDAVEHVLEDGLRTKTDAKADNACGSDKRAERHSNGAQQLHADIRHNKGVGAGANDSGGSAELGGALSVSDQAVGAALHAPDEEKGHPLQDESDEQGDDDLGQAVLQEAYEVGVPAVLKGAQCVLVLWDVVGKLHDDGVRGLWH